MVFVYGAVWLVAAYLLIFKLSKENKIFRFLGVFFIIMAIWWIADGINPDLNMLEGTSAWILRGIGAIFLAVTGVFYYKNLYKKEK